MAATCWAAFISYRSRRLARAGADGAIELGENEVEGLVVHREDGALVELIGRDGLANLGAVKVQALNLGAGEKALGLAPEEEHGGVGIGGGNALGILETIVATKEADVEGGGGDLFQIDLIETTIRGGDVLKNQDAKEAARERIALNEGADGPPVLGKLALNAAEKNGLHARGLVRCGRI